VESANKLVVEARLKGGGMHWRRGNITPMVALRASRCYGRWAAPTPADTVLGCQEAAANSAGLG
jgi:hypothetical protein